MKLKEKVTEKQLLVLGFERNTVYEDSCTYSFNLNVGSLHIDLDKDRCIEIQMDDWHYKALPNILFDMFELGYIERS